MRILNPTYGNSFDTKHYIPNDLVSNPSTGAFFSLTGKGTLKSAFGNWDETPGSWPSFPVSVQTVVSLSGSEFLISRLHIQRINLMICDSNLTTLFVIPIRSQSLQFWWRGHLKNIIIRLRRFTAGKRIVCKRLLLQTKQCIQILTFCSLQISEPAFS